MLPADDAILAELGKALEVRTGAAVGRSITIRESMPAPATAASWKSMRSTTRSMTLSASASGSRRRRAMPTCLLVTGPVTPHNMRVPWKRTYAGDPRSEMGGGGRRLRRGCGVFAESYATVGAVDKVVPVDLVIKGCPEADRSGEGLLARMDQATVRKSVP